MKTEQLKQAENLYFHTNLTKTEIADAVGVSRRTLHYWVSHNHWDTIRQAAQSMPTIITGNCYIILSQLQNSILARTDEPITTQEVNAMAKLVNTVTKLNAKAALCENLEALTNFLDFTQHADPTLAARLQPIVAAYAGHTAAAQQPPGAPPPSPRESPEELLLDQEDLAALAAEQKAATQPVATPTPHTKPTPAIPHTKPRTMPPPAPHLNRAARRAMARNSANKNT